MDYEMTEELVGNFFVNEDGDVIPYDACATSPNCYDMNIFKFVGTGIPCVVDGEIQEATWEDHESFGFAWYFYQYR